MRVVPILLFLIAAVRLGHASDGWEEKVNWDTIQRLDGPGLIQHYEESLNFQGAEAIEFWKRLPVSKANRQIYKLFRKQMFAFFISKHPSRTADRGESFTLGGGRDIVGPLSGQPLKLPFSGIIPLAPGPVGEPDRIYKIGYSIHGFEHPWLLNNADSAIWEANRHPNVELEVLDTEFDDMRQAEHIRKWIAEGYDGILVWPRVEGPAAEPIHEAMDKGITVASVDRLTGTTKITHRIVGDFPANGAMQGLYLIHKLLKEERDVSGNIVLIRKPLASADAYRTGHFLKIASYFPGLRIVANYHNNSSRSESKEQVLDALARLETVDIIFCTGGAQSMGAVDALNMTGRWFSRENKRKIILLSSDDSRASMNAIAVGKQDMLSPYTPLLGGIALRAVLRSLSGDELPRDIAVPYIPMVTRRSQHIFGFQTLSVQEWMPYAYGPDEKQEGFENQQ